MLIFHFVKDMSSQYFRILLVISRTIVVVSFLDDLAHLFDYRILFIFIFNFDQEWGSRVTSFCHKSRRYLSPCKNSSTCTCEIYVSNQCILSSTRRCSRLWTLLQGILCLCFSVMNAPLGITDQCFTVAYLFMRSAHNTMGIRETPEWHPGLVAPLVRGPKWS